MIPTKTAMCDIRFMKARMLMKSAALIVVTGLVGLRVLADEASSPERVEAPAVATNDSTASGSGESAFSIVAERNIFNANRVGAVRVASRRAVVTESFALVGTIIYPKGTFAFFEGSSSELTKAAKAEDVIGGHQVIEVLPNSVKLRRADDEVELPVGSQMRREDAGPWQIAEGRPASRSSFDRGSDRGNDFGGRNGRGDRSDRSDRFRRSGSSNGNGETRASTAASSGPEDEDVLKRLMEQREKETQ